VKHSQKNFSDAEFGQLWSLATSKPKSLFTQSPFIRAVVQIVLIQSSLWVLLILLALPDWSSTRFYTFDLRQSPEEIASAGNSDVSGYVQTGLELAESGAVSEQNLWRLRLFGPGMTYFYAAVIKFFGNDDLFILRVLLLAVLSWACLLTSVIRYLIRNHGLAYASLASLPTLIFAWPSEGMFNRNLLGSDVWALYWLCLGFWLIYRASQTSDSTVKRALLILVAGCSLSIAMLIAGRYAFIVNCLAFTLTAAWLMAIAKKCRLRRLSPQLQRTSLSILVVSILIALLGTVPWRIYSEHHLMPGSYALRASEYYWSQRWMPDSYLLENGIGFLERGGANWACEISPIECQRIYNQEVQTIGSNYNGTGTTREEFRSLAIDAAVRKPHLYLKNRLSHLSSAWFGFKEPSTSHQRVSQVFGLLALIACLLRLVVVQARRFPGQIDLATRICGITIIVAILSPFLLFHFEYRYLLPLRFLAIAAFPILVMKSRRTMKHFWDVRYW